MDLVPFAFEVASEEDWGLGAEEVARWVLLGFDPDPDASGGLVALNTLSFLFVSSRSSKGTEVCGCFLPFSGSPLSVALPFGGLNPVVGEGNLDLKDENMFLGLVV